MSKSTSIILNIKLMRETLDLLTLYQINHADVIFVGGTVMEAMGLRVSGDIDIILEPGKRNKLEQSFNRNVRGPFEAINLNSDIQILKNPYRFLDIYDNDCFYKKMYCVIDLEGLNIQVIRPELEFGKKLFRGREKDRNDLILLQQYAENTKDWRWDLIPVSPVNKHSDKLHSGNKLQFMKKISRKMVQGFHHPVQSLRSFQRLTKRHIIQKIKQKNILRSRLPPMSLCNQMVDIGTLLQWQFHNGEFTRYDTLVRLQTLKDYLALNGETTSSFVNNYAKSIDDVFELYDKMQDLRVKRKTTLFYRDLIDTIQRKGYHTDRYPIKIDRLGRLEDGSHRLACALAFGIDRLPVQFSSKSNGPTNYGRSWFEERKFNSQYLTLLDTTLNDILLSAGTAFVLIIWPPANRFADEIIDMISQRYAVIAQSRDVRITNLPDLVEDLYLSDDIERWKIKKKIYHMAEYPPVVSIVAFLIPDPAYRIKTRTESYLSDTVAQLKAEIRGNYKKEIDGYVHDIIAHIGDNPAMNRDMVEALKKYGINLGENQQRCLQK